MKWLLSILLGWVSWVAGEEVRAGEAALPPIKAYHTRLLFEDHGFTGKYAGIVIEMPQRGQFTFSREFGDQPRWLPLGGKPQSVPRLIPRQGDGPDQRPDNHDIGGVAAYWRPGVSGTCLSFDSYRSAVTQPWTFVVVLSIL